MDNLFPDASEPDTNYPPLHLFDPSDYPYSPPATSEYDPLEGVKVPTEMPRYPDNTPNPDYGKGDPFPLPNLSVGGDPFPLPDLSGGGELFPLPDLSGKDDLFSRFNAFSFLRNFFGQ